MSAVTIHQMADRVAQLLEERLGLGGRDLSAKLKRAGRMLPKKVRDSGKVLAAAAHKAQNPKLLGQIDMGDVTEAYDVCVKHLIAIDPVGRRRDLFAGMVGSVGLGVLVLAVALLGFLAWRGYF
ncbi:hypothetical protein [Tabrizicola sp.]|jgi:hypothetical protein|uniref:hypothetical protein n=1 Tax=Tabrizicola sp. TaxID=2005166 RepID=UPI001A5070A0|nr:hypothetical protein [Tabrizicola sp.]MBL9063427.1 hypothetical protein [Tabrizicola sp.]